MSFDLSHSVEGRKKYRGEFSLSRSGTSEAAQMGKKEN
jgi:hypothetical protein